MSFFNTIFRWLGGNANTQRSGSQQVMPASTVHDEAPVLSVDGAMQVSTVWSCVTLLTETISSLPLMVYQADAEGNREPASDRLYKVLHDAPNNRQTSQEFWEQMLLNFFLRGNAYARIVRDSRGAVLSLWPLSADQIDVVVLEDGSVIYRYLENVNGQRELIFLAKDILHIKGPGNGIVGMSRLDYMRSSVGLAINAQNHTNKTFSKNARRPGILMSSELLTDAQRAALKKNFGDITSGTDKELYVLEAQFKFDPLGMSPADIQLLESRQFAVQDLARWFGVPSVLINDTGETTALGSSVVQIVDGFYRLTLRPQVERIEQAIMKRVLTAAQRTSGLTVEFNLDALLRSSLSERMDIYSKGVQNGIYNRNEPRKRENLPPYDGGEIYTAQVNLMPVKQLGEQQPQRRAGEVAPETIEQ
jgi:HK97 family phage portal protein